MLLSCKGFVSFPLSFAFLYTLLFLQYILKMEEGWQVVLSPLYLITLSKCSSLEQLHSVFTINCPVMGTVFTLDLTVSSPGLLLFSMFRACLSAAVGCFKAWDTFVSELVSTWVFVSQRLGREEGNPLSGQCAPTQMWHSSVGYLGCVCIGVSFDLSFSVEDVDGKGLYA